MDSVEIRHSARGDPTANRAADAELKLQAALELLEDARKQRDAYHSMVRQLQDQLRNVGRTDKAALSEKADKVGPLKSKGRWSEETDALEKFMERYQDLRDWPELMMRVLLLVRDQAEDGGWRGHDLLGRVGAAFQYGAARDHRSA